MPDPDNQPSPEIRELIRRAAEAARGDRASDVFARMDEDDRRDEADSFGEDSKPPPSHLSESSAWFDSSSDLGRSTGSDQSEQSTAEAPEAESGLGTHGLSDRIDEPSLSNPTPSSFREANSSRATLISTPSFRPTRRPPMALLRVYDDDQRDAEVFRVRQTPFVIGRQDGDVVIGHERQMSRRHARIDRIQEGDVWRWYLGDLKSTNGTFQRVDQTPLRDGTEVLLGGELVRFVHPPKESPTLVKVAPAAEDERILLSGESHLIGADASQCLPFLRSAPYLDPSNYRIERRGGGWRLVDLGSTNHLWVVITKRVELTSDAMFQIGEQRFSFHLP